MASRRAYLRLSHLSEDLAGNDERVGSVLRQVDGIMVLAAWIRKNRCYIIGSWSCLGLTPSTTPFSRQSSLMDARFSLQRENSRRGFSLYVSFIYFNIAICSNNPLVSTSHQKVALEIDFSGALWVRVPMTVLAFRHTYLREGIHRNHHYTQQQRAQDYSPPL